MKSGHDRDERADAVKAGWEIAGGGVETFRLPLKEPFITALGRSPDTVNVGLHLRLKNGSYGYGEASGSVVMAHLRPEALARILRRELALAAGKDARRFKSLAAGCWERNRGAPPAAAAFECALTEALARGLGLRLCDWFGGARTELETDLTLSAAPPPAAAAAARRALAEGFRVLKVKVGSGTGEDLRRVLAVWEEARSGAARARLILDGNQGMAPAQALRLAEACARRDIRLALFEQPVLKGDLKGMAWLRRRSPVPVAADESVRSAGGALAVLEAQAADVINVKVAKTGLEESLSIVALARAAGKKLMIGCMRETARGLCASAHLACGTGAFAFVDLDSDHLIAGPQPQGDFRREGPRLALTGRFGGPSRAGWSRSVIFRRGAPFRGLGGRG